ncbi:hypothetical protein AAG906_024783 [Vitis piasezkii]
MSSILHVDSSCRESILDVPATLGRHNKRWHLAFATIYCSRALHSLLKQKKSSKPPVSTHSCVVLSVEPHLAFPNIDHTSLTAVVKEKNLDQLRELGGVEGVADALKTHTKNGIHGAVEDVAERQETQNRQFEKLSKVSNNIEVEVVRGGHRQKISIFDIVVGDVACLKIGDQVPADGLFLAGHSLQVDESSMTGESDHVEINSSQNPFLFSGTKAADGYAQMLVTSVGINTTWGEMMSTISRDINEQTPLQARLNKLTSSIGKVGLAVAFLVLVVLVVRYFTGNTEDENGNQEFNGSKTKADDMVNAMVRIIAAAVTIVVVAIPEGLPLAVTLTLAYSMKRMMADQAMVRKLSACETMGSATTICTDKTGTLTLNQMKVTKYWLGKEPVEESSSIVTNVLELIQQGVALNTTGSIYRATSKSEFEFSGSPTEKAILSWAVLELDMDMERLKQNYTILHVEAFNSEKKRSGILMRKKADNKIHVHWKGAAEMILAMCSSYYDASGSMKELDDGERMTFVQIIQGMAASSLRCIAFAHKQIPEEEQEIREGRQS